ncbi:carbohydrate kinase family protein [Salinibacterium sp. M195]|uniref:carbohydrate kinase family protein n=1 Tax=Salinibacterium sp. M195 TaxID=2583374 RepID=UPI001C62E9D9|nr:carbohydrate kinase family protein [Salinibacterium sp. M195]QYH35417.1 carbohydrate kinase family protein [Salinibacterium sp. M195]
MSEPREIVLAGHICIDIATDLTNFSSIRPGALVEVGRAGWSIGGTIANTGGTLQELGVPIRIAGAISDDELGRTARSTLEAKGMPDNDLQTSTAAGTSYSIVLQADGTDRSFLHYPGANEFFDPTAVTVTDASIVHFGYPSLMRGMLENSGEPIRILLERAHAAGATTSIDLAVVDPSSRVASLDWAQIFANVLPTVDVASPSLDDLTSALGISEPFSIELVERLAASLIEQGVAVVALSAGANGVFVTTASPERLRRGGRTLAAVANEWGSRELWQPPLPVKNWASTNGAGDALTAGLLYSLWAGRSLSDAARTAAASAAIRMQGEVATKDALARMLEAHPAVPPHQLHESS